MSKILIPAVLALSALIVGERPVTPGFSVFAVLQSERTVTGLLPGNRLQFDAISSTGEAVKLDIEKPPEWSSLKLACDIEWSQDTKLFIIRAVAWSGELRGLWEELRLWSDGKLITVRGLDVKHIRFEYVASNKMPATQR